MDSVKLDPHAGFMLHDVLISMAIVLGLLALDLAAMRWGEDTRTPALMREAWPRV
jgi:hypothetical protein